MVDRRYNVHGPAVPSFFVDSVRKIMPKSTLSPPDSAEREYTRTLTKYVRSLRDDVNRVLIPAMKRSKAEWDQETRLDNWADWITEALLLLEALARGRTDEVLLTLPGQYQQINRHNDRQFRMVVRANTGLDLPEAQAVSAIRRGLGVNVLRAEPYLQPLFDGWIAENTRLIRSIPEQYHSGLREVLNRNIQNGASIADLTKEIQSRYGVTRNRAKLIAQDQTLTAYARLTEYRAKSVGANEYIWRTVRDNRVRPAHRDLEGKQFSFDKPPSVGNPGQPIRCRCRPELVFDDDL